MGCICFTITRSVVILCLYKWEIRTHQLKYVIGQIGDRSISSAATLEAQYSHLL
ncbi:hypothetical protein [Fortiea contorta]|uniref:hypothetical protein n=1 Tax=Fortiea contorta TaxID=1892405 RepID=UPI000349D241|nr:hypothetical protein [Fortiea contorta]